MKRLELLLENVLITINNACLKEDNYISTIRETTDIIFNDNQSGEIKFVVSQTILGGSAWSYDAEPDLGEVELTLDSAVVELYGNSGNRLTNVEKALNDLLQKKSGSILNF